DGRRTRKKTPSAENSIAGENHRCRRQDHAGELCELLSFKSFAHHPNLRKSLRRAGGCRSFEGLPQSSDGGVFCGQAIRWRWCLPLHHAATTFEGDAVKRADKVVVAGIQCSLSDDPKLNTEKITTFVEKAHKEGAQIILPSELFQGHYFCKEEKEEFF